MKGLGTDIIEIARIRQSLDEFGIHFMNRHFTSLEIAYCKKARRPEERFAGRFAAKEAIVKALGTGFVGIGFLDIEILNDQNGAPKAHIKIDPHKNLTILLSISHCHLFATATAAIF